MNPISEFFEIEKLKETIKTQSEIIEYYRHGFQAKITGLDPNNLDQIKSAMTGQDYHMSLRSEHP